MILTYGINNACFNTYVMLFNDIFTKQFEVSENYSIFPKHLNMFLQEGG